MVEDGNTTPNHSERNCYDCNTAHSKAFRKSVGMQSVGARFGPCGCDGSYGCHSTLVGIGGTTPGGVEPLLVCSGNPSLYQGSSKEVAGLYTDINEDTMSDVFGDSWEHEQDRREVTVEADNMLLSLFFTETSKPHTKVGQVKTRKTVREVAASVRKRSKYWLAVCQMALVAAIEEKNIA
ncbi:unnamed protein product, partial [Pylaiella littoralis]